MVKADRSRLFKVQHLLTAWVHADLPKRSPELSVQSPLGVPRRLPDWKYAGAAHADAHSHRGAYIAAAHHPRADRHARAHTGADRDAGPYDSATHDARANRDTGPHDRAARDAQADRTRGRQ